jgi:ABC-type multidrug transport system permease subunit
MIIFEEMSREKAMNLRMGLLMIGCSNVAYWISWIVTGLIFSAIEATLMYVIGYLFHFSVFLNTPFYVFFIIVFAVSVLNLAIAFFLLTLIHN